MINLIIGRFAAYINVIEGLLYKVRGLGLLYH